MRKLLIALGLLLLVAGLAWPWLQHLRLGHLPGDLSIQVGEARLYIPLATSLLFSLVLSAALWLMSR